MEINGEYKLTYTVDDILTEMIVIVKLKEIIPLINSFQNVYYGIAYVDGNLYLKKDLSHTVNAKCAAEEIGLELKDELKKRFRKEGKIFRLKKEEIK